MAALALMRLGLWGAVLNPALVEWMMGLPDGWVTKVPGLRRNAQLKALGNGVVPQQAVLALSLLLPRLPAYVLEQLYAETELAEAGDAA